MESNNESKAESALPSSAERSETAQREERVLEFWKKNNIFEKSLKKPSPKGEFIFYEGPPTANGKPGIHHLEARAFKDLIPRYKTMRGYHVRRKGGWDTHGLPVELQVEKKLGLNSKKAIEEYGVAQFKKECKESVWEYLEYWNKFTERMGYFVDQKNPYVTYHNDYIESVWNVIKKVNEQNLLYKDYKVVPWCPRCGTALSSHELAQGYEDIKDLSVYVKFKVKGQENTFILAWTTTPWTLPGNVALAVGENIKYTALRIQGTQELYILANDRIASVFKDQPIEIVHENILGKDLVGLEYEPLYPFFKNVISESEKPKLDKAYKVYLADFVTTEDGTGVVHTAVMYGQDDFVLGNEIGLPKHHLVGLDGKFLSGTGFLEGRFVRDEEVAVDIIKDLAGRGLLFKKEKYEHSYPHCWRCKTALIYYARDSWYIKISDRIKKGMIEENETINWEPSHIREGRFGEWLKDAKDWAISRERYWGTPLPVWTCDTCKKVDVIGGIEELKSKTRKSGNRYFVMRHGEAENNIQEDVFHEEEELRAKLTEKGKGQIKDSSKNFKAKVDAVFCSTMVRAKETAELFCEQINFPKDKVIYDERIKEWTPSTLFEGKQRISFKEYYDYKYLDHPDEVLPGGESFAQVIKRVGDFIYEINSKYSNKNILIISHGNATSALSFIVGGFSLDSLSSKNNPLIYLKNAEIREFNFVPLPHNENYELDLHKPYIDEVELRCTHSTGGQVCGGKLSRSKEVMDVWLDSGAMPFAEDHYPFENRKWIEGKGYPADFISEAIDQTRGWFYTLHAVGVLMGRGKAFKNVICLGHLLDAKGKKMSKSLGNVIDPWNMMDKYGADTLRLWMYSVNQPGESKNFDEKTVLELHRQVFGLLYNVLAFYDLYRDKSLEEKECKHPSNILDKWILSRLDELINISTENLDSFKLLEPARAIRDFIGDLSTWYLRRSRDRIKSSSAEGSGRTQEGDEAKRTLYYVLKTLVKIMAPFAPFATEDIWLKLKNEKDKESVHLEKWPEERKKILQEIFGFLKKAPVVEEMEKTREIVSLGLEARQRAGIKVRQPLSSIQIKMKDGTLEDEYIALIKDELNVKEIIFNEEIENEILLDTNLTEELKEEGFYRELLRGIQDIRKKMGLTPNDVVSIAVETSEEGKKLIRKFETDLLKVVLASKIEFKSNNEPEIKINELVFKLEIKK